MTKLWSCIIKCDYCKVKVETSGQLPAGWREIYYEYHSDIANGIVRRDYHCCTDSQCQAKLQEHKETEGLHETKI